VALPYTGAARILQVSAKAAFGPPRWQSSARRAHETMAGVDDIVSLSRSESVTTGRRLQYLTIAWNSVECVVALIAGFVAGSVALGGFGFDSAIEVISSLAALWRLHRDEDEARRETSERHTARVIGACFLLLAGYVLFNAVEVFARGQLPERSIPGIVIAALSLIVMPLLVRYKRRVATRLGSGALEAEARQTRVCAFLSAILLAGLGLNAWLGWWWADPVAGLAMVPLIAWEGWQAMTGRTCCAD
jgi:divalent metal cation (Fe/Co/Zn/Cd) transporter